VVVVGGGPAGSTAAAVLAELGHEVLLIDKARFPRKKPCGDSIMPPAVAVARRLGLGELIDSSLTIESARVVFDHRRQTNTSFLGSAESLPCCITRDVFDAALLRAATERGVDYLHARVESVEPGETVQRLSAVAQAKSVDVRGHVVIAADGATSRLRRLSGGRAIRPGAYAIRQYFRTEKPLQPVLHMDFPLELDGQALAGYGWVFPIRENQANVGVGFLRFPHTALPSLRQILRAYVADLETKAASAPSSRSGNRSARRSASARRSRFRAAPPSPWWGTLPAPLIPSPARGSRLR
jgi:flavin-dependent dehydrogenase